MIEFIKPEFIHSDDRGTLIQLVSNGWEQVNVSKSTIGTVRGGHYHKVSKEAFYIIDGKLKLTLMNINTLEKQYFDISAGNFFIIYPYIQHHFEFLQDTVMVAMYDKKVVSDENIDIYTNEK